MCGSVWKNMEGQLSFLKHVISAPPEVFTFMHSPRNLVYVDNLHSHEQQLGLSSHAWLSLDLLDVLCQLAGKAHTVLVSSFLQYPLTHCPTLLLGMTHIKIAKNLIQREVVSAILPVIITNTQDSGFIRNMRHQNAELVLWGIIEIQKVWKAHDNAITSSQLVEEIQKVNATILDGNSKLQNGEAKDPSASSAYGDDVEAEANAYFHQVFSGC